MSKHATHHRFSSPYFGNLAVSHETTSRCCARREIIKHHHYQHLPPQERQNGRVGKCLHFPIPKTGNKPVDMKDHEGKRRSTAFRKTDLGYQRNRTPSSRIVFEFRFLCTPRGRRGRMKGVYRGGRAEFRTFRDGFAKRRRGMDCQTERKLDL